MAAILGHSGVLGVTNEAYQLAVGVSPEDLVSLIIEIVHPFYMHPDPPRCSGSRQFSSIGLGMYSIHLVYLHSVTFQALHPIGLLLLIGLFFSFTHEWR